MLAAVMRLDLVASVLLAAGAAAGEPEVLRQWDFNAPAEAAGWTAGPQLRDLGVEAGCLRMEITGPDAWIVLPPFEAALDGLTVRVRLRADHAGESQVYWTTRDSPQFNESLQMTQFTPAARDADDFVRLEFAIGSPADAGRTLTGLRIDPCNRVAAGRVAFDAVEVLRAAPVREVVFASSAARVDPDDPVVFRAACRPLAGRVAGPGVRLAIAGEPPAAATADAKGLAARTRTLRFDRPGWHRVRATCRPDDSPDPYDLETSVVVGGATSLPTQPGLRTDRLRLDLVPAPDGRHVGAARWQIAGDDGRFRQAGWLLPLAEVALRHADGRIVRRQPALKVVALAPDRVALAGGLEPDGNWHIEVECRAAGADASPFIDVAARLTGPDGGRLLDFTGPVLRADRDDPAADPLDRHAVFGGIEFLEPGWRSSSDRAVGPLFADRWTPHPFKITLPVMAVETGGLTTALMWQPLEPWDGTEALPAATFASPSFLDGQPNHLMKLSVPSIPVWRSENEAVARVPYVIRADRPLALRYRLVGQPDTPAARTARTWYALFGLPEAPPRPHDDRTTYDLFARHLGETMYWPAEKGWRHHWFIERASAFTPWMAAELLAHAAATGDRRWVDRTHLAGRPIVDTAGPLAARLADAAPADAAAAAMRPDGTWTFVHTPGLRDKVRQTTTGRFDSLGDEGTTSLGTCAVRALPLLHHALLAGRQEHVRPALKALEAMRRFRVPRGAQVWEVHKDIPDIRAAALAVEAFHIGYRITGDRSYLEQAGDWAWAGVPFLYSWPVPVERPGGYLVAARGRDEPASVASYLPFSEAFENPDRRVTPFGSVPVLGPTMYVINWFGVIVQWCGLEWAAKVIALDRDRPDPLLRAIADGVVASGLQQTFDRPPWVGLYPDVWDTRTHVAQGAFICARLPAECLQAQGRLPAWARPWTRVIRDPDGQRRWHVSGWGTPPALSWPTAGNPLLVPTEFLPGEPNELILAGADRPRVVRAGDQVLQLLDSTEVAPASTGWRYDAVIRALSVRFTQTDRQMTVRIAW